MSKGKRRQSEQCEVCQKPLCKFGKDCDQKQTCRFHHLSDHDAIELQNQADYRTKKLKEAFENPDKKFKDKLHGLTSYRKLMQQIIRVNPKLSCDYDFLEEVFSAIPELDYFTWYCKEYHKIASLFDDTRKMEAAKTELEKVLSGDDVTITPEQKWDLLRVLCDFEKTQSSKHDSYNKILHRRLEFAKDSKNPNWLFYSHLGFFETHCENENLESAWNALECMLEINIQTGEERKIGKVYSMMIKFVKQYGEIGNLGVLDLLHKQLTLEEKSSNVKGQGIKIAEIIKWYEVNSPDEIGKMLEYAEKGLDVARAAGDRISLMHTISRKIRMIETYFPDEVNEDYLTLLLEFTDLTKELEEFERHCSGLVKIAEFSEYTTIEHLDTPMHYLEEACEIAENNNLIFWRSRVYQAIIVSLYNSEPVDEDLIYEYLEKKLRLSRENQDDKTRSMTLAQMVTWRTRFDADNLKEIRRLYLEMLNLARTTDNLNQHIIALIKLIHWNNDYEDEVPYEDQKQLYEELIQLQDNSNNLDRGRTISSYITWLESINSPESRDRQWELLLKLFDLGMELGDDMGMSMTTQKMINWKKNFQSSDIDSIWNLLERRLKLGVQSDDNFNQIMIMNSMVTFLEENRPEEHSLIWETMLNIMKISEKPKEIRVILRKLARFSKSMNYQSPYIVDEEFLAYPSNNPYEILFHFSTLLILNRLAELNTYPTPEYDSSFVDSIIHQQLSLYTEDVGDETLTDGRCLSIRFESITDLGMIQSNFVSTIHQQSQKVILSLDKPIVIDGPNVFHSLVSEGVKEQDFLDWLNNQERQVLIHLSLNSLDEFSDLINQLFQHTNCLFLFAMTPTINEDVIMLLVAKETNATIVSNDRFRSEKRKYDELIPESVYQNVVKHHVSTEGVFDIKSK